MSTDLTTDNDLNANAQYVKDQNGNSSSLSLEKDGNIGIGTESPEHNLDVKGTVRIESSALGKGIFFSDTDFSLGDGSHRLRLQRAFGSVVLRIFEILLHDPNQKGEFFFDNVDVYPDNDNALSLGKESNRWSELHAVNGHFSGSISFSDLPEAPRNLETIEIVMDPTTGKVYRKASNQP